MRPLMEILEDERTLMLKLESVHRYILRTDDRETLDILVAQTEKIERDIGLARAELKEYIGELFEE